MIYMDTWMTDGWIYVIYMDNWMTDVCIICDTHG